MTVSVYNVQYQCWMSHQPSYLDLVCAVSIHSIHLLSMLDYIPLKRYHLLKKYCKSIAWNLYCFVGFKANLVFLSLSVEHGIKTYTAACCWMTCQRTDYWVEVWISQETLLLQLSNCLTFDSHLSRRHLFEVVSAGAEARCSVNSLFDWIWIGPC